MNLEPKFLHKAPIVTTYAVMVNNNKPMVEEFESCPNHFELTHDSLQWDPATDHFIKEENVALALVEADEGCPPVSSVVSSIGSTVIDPYGYSLRVGQIRCG